MTSHTHGDACGCCLQPASSVTQTLDELEFERGVWSAALDGDLSRVKEFFARGGDPNVTDSSSYTALHYAARNGHTDVCRLLLDHGARVDAVTKTGRVSALHRAAYCGRADIVRLLLNRGADPRLQDTDGKTALHKAVDGGRIEVVKILLGASDGRTLCQVVDNSGRTALDCLPTNCGAEWQSVLAELAGAGISHPS